jgi:hypothetical protein
VASPIVSNLSSGSSSGSATPNSGGGVGSDQTPSITHATPTSRISSEVDPQELTERLSRQNGPPPPVGPEAAKRAQDLYKSATQGRGKPVDGLKPVRESGKALSPRGAIEKIGLNGIDRVRGTILIASGDPKELHLFVKHGADWYCHCVDGDGAGQPERIDPSNFIERLRHSVPDIRIEAFNVLRKEDEDPPHTFKHFFKNLRLPDRLSQ